MIYLTANYIVSYTAAFVAGMCLGGDAHIAWVCMCIMVSVITGPWFANNPER